MENDDIINLILEQYGNIVIDNYRRLSYQGDSVASGRLVNSLGSFVVSGEGTYELFLRLEDYWKYVEYGRGPGKFPPLEKIKEWIDVKPVIPTVYNGKLPTVDQLAYLIGRKIATEGIQPKNYLQNTLDNLDLQPLEDAITRSLENKFDNIAIKEW